MIFRISSARVSVSKMLSSRQSFQPDSMGTRESETPSPDSTSTDMHLSSSSEGIPWNPAPMAARQSGSLMILCSASR